VVVELKAMEQQFPVLVDLAEEEMLETFLVGMVYQELLILAVVAVVQLATALLVEMVALVLSL
jgi:hypothetical protein